MGDIKKLEKDMKLGLIISIILGMVISISAVSISSTLRVRDTYDGGYDVGSLLCSFQRVPYQITEVKSNATGRTVIWLFVTLGNESIHLLFWRDWLEFYEMEAVNEVIVLGWKNGQMLGLAPRNVTDGKYVICHAFSSYLWNYGYQDRTDVFWINDFREATLFDTMLCEYFVEVGAIFIIILCFGSCLVFVPLIRLWIGTPSKHA